MTLSAIRVLILDDEDLVRENLAAFCEDEGYHVVQAGSGEEAVKILEGEKFDIAIVDMRLPGIDGNTVIVRAHELDPGLKFIIHTGSSTYNLPVELVRLGLTEDDIIRKPILEMDILKDRIHKIIKK